MGLRLRPLNTEMHQVGNAIIYGGMDTNYDPSAPREGQIFFVESDFGNHMKLSWAEICERWTVVGWQDYREWRQARDELINQPNLIQRMQFPYPDGD